MSSPVPIAIKSSQRTEIRTGSIAATPAILQIVTERSVPPMDERYRANLESYLASMMQAKKMLSQGILTSEDYDKIDTIIADKYGVSSCSLYRGIDLIYNNFNGNMSYYEEVTECQEP